MTNTQAMREFLIAEGWTNNPSLGTPWQWQLPAYPAAWYLLKDAYSLAQSLKRERAVGKRVAANAK